MLSLKDVLCLSAILFAYGIAGRIDDDDETPREAAHATVAAADRCEEHGLQGPVASTNVLAVKTTVEVPRAANCLGIEP